MNFADYSVDHRNQAEFCPKMHYALSELAKGRLLGNAELLLFYGFRKPGSGDLDIGM
jgi:hypothetical protein